jgi:hypothetical protein
MIITFYRRAVLRGFSQALFRSTSVLGVSVYSTVIFLGGLYEFMCGLCPLGIKLKWYTLSPLRYVFTSKLAFYAGFMLALTC